MSSEVDTVWLSGNLEAVQNWMQYSDETKNRGRINNTSSIIFVVQWE